MGLHTFRLVRQCSQLPSLFSTLQFPKKPLEHFVVPRFGVSVDPPRWRRGFAAENNDSTDKQSPNEEAKLPQADYTRKPGKEQSIEADRSFSAREQIASKQASESPDSAPPTFSTSFNTEQSQPPSDSQEDITQNQTAQLRTLHHAYLQQLKTRTTPLISEQNQPRMGLTGMIGHVSILIAAWLSNATVQRVIETDHDSNEFLRGAKDAIEAVFELLHEENWEGLKSMVSSSVLKALRELHEDHAQHKLTLIQYPAADVQPVYAIFSWLHRDRVGRWDEVDDDVEPLTTPPAHTSEPPVGAATATLDPPPTAYGALPFFPSFFGQYAKLDFSEYYQVAQVFFSASLKTEVKKDDGQVVAEALDRRIQQWVFARGPLPSDLPHRELQLNWKLLTIR